MVKSNVVKAVPWHINPSRALGCHLCLFKRRASYWEAGIQSSCLSFSCQKHRKQSIMAYAPVPERGLIRAERPPRGLPGLGHMLTAALGDCVFFLLAAVEHNNVFFCCCCVCLFWIGSCSSLLYTCCSVLAHLRVASVQMAARAILFLIASSIPRLPLFTSSFPP